MRISGLRNDPDFPANAAEITVWFNGNPVRGDRVLSADDATGELELATIDAKGEYIFDGHDDLIVEHKTGRVEIKIRPGVTSEDR